jgi:hypothetical protein
MMRLLEAVEQIIRERGIMLRIDADEQGVVISEWPSCMVRATGDTLAKTLRSYLPANLRRKVKADQ